ncbi:N-6 DNA methylase [Streptomyces sp. NPDC046557]|uniref:N-6 DNA methylase n=1 Tax=Streptomyces sp. NPDC046557 TaxID=3155372 RepID=UPI0033E1C427
MSSNHVEVTSADIARITGVRPTAVSNWRRRHEDFPQPVGGTERSPRFDLGEVEAWLRREGKTPEIPPGQRLWQALGSVRDVMPLDDALGMAGTLLLHLHEHPGTTVPPTASGCSRLMQAADQTLTLSRGARAGVTALLAHSPGHEFGPGQIQLLRAAADAADADGPAAAFEELCTRYLSGGPRAGFNPTPPALASLMVALAGPTQGTLLDPACGSGTIMLAAADAGFTRLHGQEQNPSLARLAALRLAFRAAVSGGPTVVYDVHAEDFLRHPAYPRRASAVVGNPPFADRTWGHEDLADSPVWGYGVPPRGESELAWAQQALAHALPGAPVVLLMPPAAAVRPSGRRIRAALLRRGALRAVISLPPGFAAHYNLPLQIWVMRRPEVSAHDLGERDGTGHLLVVDASEVAEPLPVVTEIWSDYHAAPESFAPRPGMARMVPLIELLHDADVTPRRHLPQAEPGRMPQEALVAARSVFEAAASALTTRVPPLPLSPELSTDDLPTARTVALGDLIKSGAIVHHRPGPPSGPDEAPSEPGEARYLLVRDITSGRPASGIGPAPEEPLLYPLIRAGDILLPMLAREVVARVATGGDVGTYAGSGIHHLRVTDPELVDPWYLAGFLSSAEGGRQAASVTSTLSTRTRVDPRRVRIPLPPIGRQRAYGHAFRSIAEFTTAVRAVHDLGIGLARDLTETIAADLRASLADNQPAAHR